jgi:amino acid transporter
MSTAVGEQAPTGDLHRTLNWTHAFWVASGVPALVLFSIGPVASTVGYPSWLAWTISIVFGFLQAFTYAEIAGLFPDKSGGASIYGAIAWVRYSKILAPISVWCNWFAWSPVRAIGAGLAAGYIINAFFPPDSQFLSWQLTLLNLDFIAPGLTIRIDAVFVLGAIIMLATFAMQIRGIAGAARIQTIFAVSTLVPLILIGLIPLLTGKIASENLFPFLPLARGPDGSALLDGAGNVVNGAWDMAGITLFGGGLFLAAWSTYGFETAVCYVGEFRDPKRDTFKAIFYSGLLCLLVYTLVPFAFQGALGLKRILDPSIVDGSGVAVAMADVVGVTGVAVKAVVVMLLLSVLLSMMTAMAGASRTMYQASVDGWLPKFLSHCNSHGAPVRAMWVDFLFNILLLSMSDYRVVLAAANVGYIIFNFMNLNSGWIHRIDRGKWERPFRCPTWLLATGGALAFVNAFLLGIGADTWGKGTLVLGFSFAALVIPVFVFRHYVVDKGRFPGAPIDSDDHPEKHGAATSKAGFLPYLALIAGAAVVYIGHTIARY